jgi:CxxC motif-containing protein (DUF1111 family)
MKAAASPSLARTCARRACHLLLLMSLLAPGFVLAQADPGPRPGPAGAGGPFPGLNATEQAQFAAALRVFQEVDSVSGGVAGETGVGLGPTFNGNSCAQCHAQPAVGGTSPGLASPQHPMPNPQVALATLDGAHNTVPPFITPGGPIREARFITTGGSNPSLDGGVHDLYTIAGRVDAPGCNMAQPDFAGQLAANNVIFRIPTPVFGLGLVENTSDEALRANLAATATQRAALGIGGRFNTSGNDGTITRFGWKAQNKSIEVFDGEAYNVEQGVTNELFQNERGSPPPSCVFNPTPEDHTDLTVAPPGPSDVTDFGIFQRLSAPPTPAAPTPSTSNGAALFSKIGCALCHSPSLTTASSPFTGMSNFTYHPYSDFALHHMGNTLTDGVRQGDAGTDEFRTAPLWGVGQRLFFLHDGRTSDLVKAIQAHATPAQNCTQSQIQELFTVNGIFRQINDYESFCSGSEANAVIANFSALGAGQQQNILDFLRSL